MTIRKVLHKLTPKFITKGYRISRAFVANAVYGFPSRKLKVIGVTGTDGKTTTCNYIYSIFKNAGKKTGLMTTINFAIGDKEWVNETKMTTVSTFALQKMIKKMVNAGVEYLILEVSSHALDQDKVWGVKFDGAVITNLSREHLDYHKTMEEYEKAKIKLFQTLFTQYLKTRSRKVSVINGEENFTERFLKYSVSDNYIYQFSTLAKNQNIKGLNIVSARNVKTKPDGIDFAVTRNGKELTAISLKMMGIFNVYNALTAISTSLGFGLSMNDCKIGLEKVGGLPGRVELIDEGQSFKVIVDYAVTPAALEKLYKGVVVPMKTQDTYSETKIIGVFGSCGDRDREKRPIMGEIVSKYADICILTNEDSWFEDPVRIIDAIEKGVTKNMSLVANSSDIKNKSYFKIIDRLRAIQKAFAIARAQDIVVITGKGAETGMQIGSKKIPWNEREIIREELKRIKK